MLRSQVVLFPGIGGDVVKLDVHLQRLMWVGGG
jgi:hypothetical protein